MLKIVETKLPKEMFGQEVNMNLLAQANHVQTSRAHIGLRSTKTRGEVNRSTKKLYKQKGTGGARHGSRRANLFVGGGIVFGPRPVKRVLTLSKSIKQAAKISAFSAKNKAKEVQIVSGFSKLAKTREVSEFLKSLKEVKKVTVLLSDSSKPSLRYLKNLKDVKILLYKNVTARQILLGGLILIDEEVFGGDKKQVTSDKKEKSVKSVKKSVKSV